MTKVYHSSKSDDWYTPAHIVAAARQVMGGIDLDPASCAAANQTVQAGRYYTIEDDGLARPWSSRVFLNPPYSRVARWTKRLLVAYNTGEIDQA
ncbi:MAG: hypothetical protein CYG59_24850, partial [Chloroflexi bacterium]